MTLQEALRALLSITTDHSEFPELEAMISKSSGHAVSYAIKAGKRFALGEPVIATNTYASYDYARKVLKNRFLLGEPNIIVTSPSIACDYARHVIKGR